MIHVLPEFEGEPNVQVMTADDFITRCYEIGVQELHPVQQGCLIKVLGKPELNNAIRLNELLILMKNFYDNEEEDDEQPQDNGRTKSSKKNKKK